MLRYNNMGEVYLSLCHKQISSLYGMFRVYGAINNARIINEPRLHDDMI